MPGYGFGFGARQGAVRQVSPAVASPLPLVTPSADWTGASGSGFANVPLDPVRQTAKPAVRLLFPPNQTFSDELMLGVIAGANDSGSLMLNMGLEKVIVHYEGSTQEILAPSFQTLLDPAGSYQSYLGWWCLLRNDGRNGDGHVYFEAIPRDRTMQSRVIGPYTFSPQNRLHDHSLTVEPSLPEIPGQRYATVGDALAYLKAQQADNPLVTIMETGDYDIVVPAGSPSSSNWGQSGWCTIAHAPGVVATIGKPEYVSDSVNSYRIAYDRLQFKGDGIRFDMKYISSFYTESEEGAYWMNGVHIFNSGGREQLWRGGGYPVAYILRHGYFTDCKIRHMGNPLNNALIARGNDLAEGMSDVGKATPCMVGNRIHDWDSSFFNSYEEIVSITYAGPGVATVERSGSKDRLYTLRVDGAEVGTFATGPGEEYYTGEEGDGYWPEDLASWINALGPEWSATALDNQYSLQAIGLRGNKAGNFGATEITPGFALTKYFDMHSDFWQQNQGVPAENIVVCDNVLTQVDCQILFCTSDATLRDMLVFNECYRFYAGDGTTLLSQMAGPHSHVVMVHISMADQTLAFRGGYDGDSYCLYANNVTKGAYWEGVPDVDPTLKGLHFYAGRSELEYASGTTTGGDGASLWVDAAAGDFTPAGLLIGDAYLRAPVIAYDASGTPRQPLDTIGARGLGDQQPVQVPGIFRLEGVTMDVEEGQDVVVRIVREGPSLQASELLLQVTAGDTDGSDWGGIIPQLPVTMLPGETARDLVVGSPAEDGTFEQAPEGYSVNLVALANASIGSVGMVAGSVTSIDPPPVGPELLVNGDFSTNSPSGWTGNGANKPADFASGEWNTSSAYHRIAQRVLEPGKVYRLQMDVARIGQYLSIRAAPDIIGSTNAYALGNAAVGHVDTVFTVPDDGTDRPYLMLFAGSGGVSLDNVSLRPVVT